MMQKAFDENTHLANKDIKILSINNRNVLFGSEDSLIFNYNIRYKKELSPTSCRIEPQYYYNQLLLLDTGLPQIFMQIAKIGYQTKKKKISKLIDLLANRNPLSYPTNSAKSFYRYKMNKALLNLACHTIKEFKATSNLPEKICEMIVRENNSPIKYFIYDVQKFQEFLLSETLFTISEKSQDARHIKFKAQLTF